jgi:transposase-like protein
MPKSYKTDELQEYLQSKKGLNEITEQSRSGKTLAEISEHFGIARTTLYTWSKKYPEIQSALSEGKHVADDRVEQSLYESCFGRTEKEVTVEKDRDGNVIKSIVRTRYIPPNITAIQYWLSNRRNDTWKARQQLEFAPDTKLPVMFVEDIPNPFIKKDVEEKDASE